MIPWYCCIIVPCPAWVAPGFSASEWPMCLAMWTIRVYANTMPAWCSPHASLEKEKWTSVMNCVLTLTWCDTNLVSISPYTHNIGTAIAWYGESMRCSAVCSAPLRCNWIWDFPIPERQANSDRDAPIVRCMLAISLWTAIGSGSNCGRLSYMVWDRCLWSVLRHRLMAAMHPDPICLRQMWNWNQDRESGNEESDLQYLSFIFDSGQPATNPRLYHNNRIITSLFQCPFFTCGLISIQKCRFRCFICCEHSPSTDIHEHSHAHKLGDRPLACIKHFLVVESISKKYCLFPVDQYSLAPVSNWHQHLFN